MKILWFANTPCGSIRRTNTDAILGGWLVSLEDEIKKMPDVQLSVCYYSTKRERKFEYGDVLYLPVYRNFTKNKVFRLIRRVFNFINWDRRELIQLIDVVNEVSPDIIHVHGCEENFGLIQQFVNVPVVISIQGILNSLICKYYNDLNGIKIAFSESFKDNLVLNSTYFHYLDLRRRAKRERVILSNSSYVLGRTSWDHRIVNFLAPRARYFHSDEILRGAFYSGNNFKIESCNEVVITSNCSNRIYKGLELIIGVCKLLQSQGIKYSWRVVGLSSGDSTVIAMKKYYGVDYGKLNIELLGLLNDKQILDLFAETSIYCQVSHIENSSNSLCEAMMFGLPIVATFAGGTDTLISNYIDGILVQCGDYISYSGAILELINSKVLRSSLSSNSRKSALIRHDRDTISSGLMSIYGEVLECYYLKDVQMSGVENHNSTSLILNDDKPSARREQC